MKDIPRTPEDWTHITSYADIFYHGTENVKDIILSYDNAYGVFHIDINLKELSCERAADIIKVIRSWANKADMPPASDCTIEWRGTYNPSNWRYYPCRY